MTTNPDPAASPPLALAGRIITLDAAQLLGIADRFGSVEAGKEADLVLYDGDPFENTTHVLNTIIAGRVVYDRRHRTKRPKWIVGPRGD